MLIATTCCSTATRYVYVRLHDKRAFAYVIELLFLSMWSGLRLGRLANVHSWRSVAADLVAPGTACGHLA